MKERYKMCLYYYETQSKFHGFVRNMWILKIRSYILLYVLYRVLKLVLRFIRIKVVKQGNGKHRQKRNTIYTLRYLRSKALNQIKNTKKPLTLIKKLPTVF